jgi:hypothetical protein
LLGTTFVPPNVVQVLVHPTVDEYNAFGDNNGEEHSSFYPSFVPENHPDQPVATLESPNGTRQLRWVTHGALHRYLLDARVELPVWLDEGLASYFALYWAFPSAVVELQALRDSDGWVSVDDLITDEIAAFLDRPEARQLELGMLFSYLMNYREDTRIERDEQGNVIASPFLDYIRLRTRNRDSAQHPVAKLLGSATSRAELDREFRAFDGW